VSVRRLHVAQDALLQSNMDRSNRICVAPLGAGIYVAGNGYTKPQSSVID
jgi:hypothetical protein